MLNRLHCYCECHHIFPRSLGGSDDKSNLVNLTAREHYIAHRLLEKITNEKFGTDSIEHGKMLHAIWRMMHDSKHKNVIKSHAYEFIKIERSKNLSKTNKGRFVSIETRQKISNSHKGKIISKETREKISKTLIGYKRPKDVCKKISNSLKGLKRPTRTLEHRLKLGAALKGKCAGKRNGCFGRKWMHHPITQNKVYAKKDEIQYYLQLGYVFGVNEATKAKNKGNFIIIDSKRKFIPNNL